jgi:hypothetical protein
MQDEEIRQKIASFPRWHYQFDLRGNLTPIHKERRAIRHAQRKKHFFGPIVRLFGGSLEGKRFWISLATLGTGRSRRSRQVPTTCWASRGDRCM